MTGSLTVYHTRLFSHKSVLVSATSRIEHGHTLASDDIIEPDLVHTVTRSFRGRLVAIIGYVHQIGWKRPVIVT